MKKLLSVVIATCFVAACIPRKFNAESGAKKRSFTAYETESPVRTWTNPTIDSTPKSGLPKPELNETPEGLILYGPDGKMATKFDRRKPTVIYIHGWTPEEDVPPVPFNSAWYQDFNTFVYRWHRRSADRQTAPLRAFSEISRVSKEYLADYERLQTSLGSFGGGEYKLEIRIVGYSLGGMLALEMNENSGFTNAATNSKPRRIDLLELITDDSGAGGIRETANTIINRYRLNHYASKAAGLKSAGVWMINFMTTSLSGMTAAMSFPEMNVQKMSGNWMGLDFQQRHTEILIAYFESYKKPVPSLVKGGLAFSAASNLFGTSRNSYFLEQVESKNAAGISSVSTRDLSDDTFKIIDNPCEPGFLSTIDTSLFDGGGNRIFNSISAPLGSWCL